ncbi:MAG: enoyl-CoA hydratase/isomerase family protein [Candidatus Promineifilaceae bacterium]|nr:enoyl-CoA hydratase/isomerase family protein [Candidatus Promineifilaceae bacterium]
MSDLILTKQRDTIFEIVLNRPEKRNAINFEMYDALDDAVHAAAQAEGVRVVFLRGAGPLFSAGIDVSNFLGLATRYGEGWRQKMRTITADFQSVLGRLERMELPTVALIHGHCLGLALELALACDLRLAADGARLALPETRLGMIPDVGGTTRLTRLIGPARAKEMIFTGRQIGAAQAERWGLVNAVVPEEDLLASGQALAEEIAQAAPLAVGMAKRVVDGAADLERGLQLEGWAQSQLFQTEDFMEAVRAFMRGESPSFHGR